MKSNEYIKRYGINQAKKAVSECTYGYGIDLIELKRLVESHELVESYGGLESAKKFVGSEYRKLSQPKTYNRLCEAILDVENCK